ncbi:hypothetical protein F5Y03DRAFT_345240 [Xylaria venustula]|nr:hypothetical protein F5Y03DRAFT_345240 [Xylaria venustula]
MMSLDEPLPRNFSDISMSSVKSDHSHRSNVSGQSLSSTSTRKPGASTTHDTEYKAGATYMDISDLRTARLPPVGTARTSHFIQQHLNGRWIPPMSFREDTWDMMGNRPLPNIPHGWVSWDHYDSQLRAVDKANAGEAPDRTAARLDLSRRRGRGEDLMEIDMKTGKARKL